jgi:hypothetical protein
MFICINLTIAPPIISRGIEWKIEILPRKKIVYLFSIPKKLLSREGFQL